MATIQKSQFGGMTLQDAHINSNQTGLGETRQTVFALIQMVKFYDEREDSGLLLFRLGLLIMPTQITTQWAVEIDTHWSKFCRKLRPSIVSGRSMINRASFF